MKEFVKDILKSYVPLTEETTFIVAFSGGWDSMCLLHIINQLSLEYPFRLIAVHLNHNWRGEESEAEEENCRKFCEMHSIELISKKLDEDVKKSELVARELRYDFFKYCAVENNVNAILTAHTKTDNAETILYRIIKGTGLNGLEGIKPVRDLDGIKVIRPILNFTRREIEAYCMSNNLFPNNDSSNLNTKYARNKIRHNIIPILKDINPNIENALVTLSEIAAGNNKIIDELIANIENQISEGDMWLTQNFLILDISIKQHFIYKMLAENDIEPSFSRVYEVINFIENNQNSKSGKTFSLTTGISLFVSHKYIYVINEEEVCAITEELMIPKEGVFSCSDKYTFSIQKYSKEVKKYPGSSSKTAFVDLSKIDFPLILRTRQNGDIIQPFGMQGKMKLKKYLINKNIPSHDRAKILLLCSGNEVLWAIGIGLGEKLKSYENPTHKLELQVNDESIG